MRWRCCGANVAVPSRSVTVSSHLRRYDRLRVVVRGGPGREASRIGRVAAPPPPLEDTLITGYRRLASDAARRPSVDLELRALDLLFSTLFLLVALPVVLPLSVALLLTSGTPLLYRGERVGRRGQTFTM